MNDPFHIVETKVEKYLIHDMETHWRMRKPKVCFFTSYIFTCIICLLILILFLTFVLLLKVGEKFVDIEQFKECMTYFALANGFFLWFERRSKTKVIAKCRLRLERIKKPELGKQSKFKRYPSEADRSVCP